MESPSKSDLIKAEVKRRRIAHVLHFTQVGRLNGIVHAGILSRADLDELEIGPRFSGARWDRNDRAVSVSVSALNYRMFKFKEKGNERDGWAVLLLDRSILWTHDCRFFPENASTTRMSKPASYGNLSGPEAFADMFADADDGNGVSRRAKYCIPDHRPTNDGAEVQVMQAIEPEHILSAWVQRADLVERVMAEMAVLPSWNGEVRVAPFCGNCPFENVHIEAERELAETYEEFRVGEFGEDVYLGDGVYLSADSKLRGLDE
jgi:hypothetical protein